MCLKVFTKLTDVPVAGDYQREAPKFQMKKIPDQQRGFGVFHLYGVVLGNAHEDELPEMGRLQ